jgi:ankyrin repeat protein
VLMCASEGGSLDVVRFLVERGGDVNVADAAGRTALFYCLSKGHYHIQRFLIARVQVTQQLHVSSDLDGYQELTTQSASSWFISPFEIELLNLIERKGVGVQFRASGWTQKSLSRSSFQERLGRLLRTR